MKSPKNIPAEIAQRGYAYFQQNKVKNIIKINENHFSASVHGSENYNCEIQLNAQGDWKNGTCDCPYDWGDVCKHQAALWYAIQENTEQIIDMKSQIKEIKTELAKLDTEKLRELLLKLAQQSHENCEQILNLLQLGKPNAPENFAKKAKTFFSYNKYVDCIEVNEHACNKWLNELDKQSDEILAQGVLALWAEADNCIAKNDYVDEDIQDCVDNLSYFLGKVVSNRRLPENLQMQIAAHLDNILVNPYYIDYMDYIYSDCYDYRTIMWANQEKYDEWLDFLNTQIQKYQNGSTYYYEKYTLEKWKLLKTLNANEADDFFEKSMNFPAFRDMAIENAEKEGNYPLMEALIKQGIVLAEEKQKRGIVADLQRKLVQAYDKQGKIQEKSQLLYEMMFATMLFDDELMSLYREWKQTITPENWERECHKIAPKMKKLSRHNYLCFLREECRQPELLEMLKQSKSLSELLEFAPSLTENQVLVLLPQFVQILRWEIEHAGSRAGYQDWVANMQNVGRQFPVFQKDLMKLLETVKAKFPRKPALQEELRKLKF
ncbi:hypothetical protein MIS45_04115 [Wielerella bovis]|uniref:SWIM zinc finger family protein n=1 Tax=Wielerella bovis TaxID=2917790 RepID=UPI002019AC77|nr:hypothetical protein [Wielerella bovis]ULJ70023.1 hypothetical protein MIS45_04115 [Wielerella bovis]